MIQNQIIKILGDHIFECVIANVKETKYTAISADEATDGSMQTQLTMTLHYVDENGNTCIHTNTDTPRCTKTQHSELYFVVCIHKFPPIIKNIYVYMTDDVKEDFIGFTNVTGNTTGEHIADVIIEKVESIDLNPSKIRAQAYGGTGNCVQI